MLYQRIHYFYVIMKVHNKKILLEIRRELRQNATPAEKILWEALRKHKLGRKFRRQHSIGNYILDFYCASKRIAIELDGSVHFEKDQIERDEERDMNLKEMEYKVLRFMNSEVETNIENVIEKIKSHF